MEPTGSLTVRVTGAREATAAATWGQRTIWQWRGLIDETSHFIHGEVHELPVGCNLEAVSDAIGHVLRRHDALRTLFQADGGTLRQVVEGSGEITVDVYQASQPEARQVALTVARQLAEAPIRNSEEWPVRLAVVAAGPSPAMLVLVSDRLAFDGHGAATVVGDLLKACTGDAAELAPRWQPVDEAEYEQSPPGQAVSERAVRYWQQTLTAAPPSMFDLSLHPPGAVRIYRPQMRSAAIAQAVRLIRKQSRLSTSALLLAAAAVVLSQYTGHREVVMRMIAGNRSGRDRKAMVGTLASDGLFLLDLGRLSFAEIARSVFRASGAAHQFAFCDPDAVAAVRDEQRLLRGAHLDLSAYFSDVQGGFAEPQSGHEAVDEPDLTEADLRKLAETTGITDMSGGEGIRGVRFLLAVVDVGDILLTLGCDTRYVPPDTMHEMLYGIERLLIAAACREIDASELAEISGVTPAQRDPAWVRCGQGWVDVGATQQLWRQVTGTSDAAVAVEETPDGGDGRRLVGYIANAGPPSFTDLHRRFVEALGERNDVRAPDWYKCTAEAPVDPGDHACWLRAPVLAEADGRPPG